MYSLLTILLAPYVFRVGLDRNRQNVSDWNRIVHLPDILSNTNLGYRQPIIIPDIVCCLRMFFTHKQGHTTAIDIDADRQTCKDVKNKGQTVQKNKTLSETKSILHMMCVTFL